MPKPIYWIKREGSLTAITSDDDSHFLEYFEIGGYLGGCQGRVNKRYTDIQIAANRWRIITNPLEAFVIECYLKQENKQ